MRSIARLPSREVLNAQLVGTIAAPLTGLVRTLNALIAGLAIQLQAIADQGLVSGEAPAAVAAPEPEPEPEAAAEPEPALRPNRSPSTSPRLRRSPSRRLRRSRSRRPLSSRRTRAGA